MRSSWVVEPFRLEFLFGEFHLFSACLDALRWTGHFSSVQEPLGAPEPPPEARARGASVVLRSYPIRDPLPRLRMVNGFIRYVPAQYRQFFIDLRDGTFDNYLQAFSPKTRSTLRRKVKKFEAYSGGNIQWREFSSPEEILTFHDLARDVSRRTYQEHLLNAGLPADEGFRRGLVAMARDDAVRGYILFHETRPIAYLHCPVKDGVAFYDHVGYDPEFRDWSPGTILQYVVIQSMFSQERFRMFDFTAGEGPHKELFATGSVLCADVVFVRPSLRNVVLVLAHTSLARFSRWCVRLIDRVGVKTKVKQWLRRR